MAICNICGREMLASAGCAIGKVHINGKVYDRIKYGAANDLHLSTVPGGRCHDCGAMPGNYHHWGCDSEACPVCGKQLIGCRCKRVYIISNKKR